MGNAPAVSRVVDKNITLSLGNGKTLTGQLEHYFMSKSFVVLDDEGLAPVLLSITADLAPKGHAALEPDQVLLCNWTDLRGVPAALADQGIVELTGEEVRVGMFRLQALVARVL